jgi:hypothetical protein
MARKPLFDPLYSRATTIAQSRSDSVALSIVSVALRIAIDCVARAFAQRPSQIVSIRMRCRLSHVTRDERCRRGRSKAVASARREVGGASV